MTRERVDDFNRKASKRLLSFRRILSCAACGAALLPRLLQLLQPLLFLFLSALSHALPKPTTSLPNQHISSKHREKNARCIHRYARQLTNLEAKACVWKQMLVKVESDELWPLATLRRRAEKPAEASRRQRARVHVHSSFGLVLLLALAAAFAFAWIALIRSLNSRRSIPFKLPSWSRCIQLIINNS